MKFTIPIALFVAMQCLSGQANAHAASPLPGHSPQMENRVQRSARRAALAVKAAENPDLAAIVRMRALERLYQREGKLAEAEALYLDVLGGNTSITIKNFAELRLARLQLRTGDAERAKQTLRQGLERNLSGR